MTRKELRDALDRAAGTPPPVDLVATAWATGRRMRRRRRVAAGAGGAVLAASLATAVALSGGLDTAGTGPADTGTSVPGPSTTTDPSATTTDPPTTTEPSTTTDPSATTAAQTVAGMPLTAITVQDRPAVALAAYDTLADLPQLDTGLPAELAMPSGPLPSVTDSPVSEIVAFSVVPLDEDAAYPVVLGPDGKWRRFDLGLPISAYDVYPVSQLAVSTDATRAVLPADGGVVVLDATDGTMTTHDLAGLTVRQARWAAINGGTEGGADSADIVVVADEGAFLVDPATGEDSPMQSREEGTPYAPAHLAQQPFAVFTGETGRLAIQPWGTDGTLGQQADLDLVGAANLETLHHDGLAAAGVLVPAEGADLSDPQTVEPARSGVLVTDAAGGPENTRILVAENLLSLRPVGWHEGMVVVQTQDAEGSWVLAWDPAAGELWRLARVSGTEQRIPEGGAYLEEYISNTTLVLGDIATGG